MGFCRLEYSAILTALKADTDITSKFHELVETAVAPMASNHIYWLHLFNLFRPHSEYLGTTAHYEFSVRDTTVGHQCSSLFCFKRM